MLNPVRRLRISLALVLVAVLPVFGASCVSREKSFLGQDLALLKGQDGKIVAAEAVAIAPPFDGLVELHKIWYLSDGLKVVGFVVRPNLDQDQFPVVIFNRGGNREYGKIDDEFLPVLATFAMHGYIVIASQYRGNDGGEGVEQYGGADVNDVLNLIPLAESLPSVAAGKIAMLGASRGGMMTYIALSRTNKVKAAAVYSGLVDCIQTFNERGPVYRQGLIDLIGGTPEEKEAEYKQRSANYWPEKIDTPLLILHGDADENVSVTQAQALAGKLQELGKACELVIYPQGSHGLIESWRDRNKRIFGWFEQYLK